MLDALLQYVPVHWPVLVFFIAWIAWSDIRHLQVQRQITALGGYAPKVTLWLPLGPTLHPCLWLKLLTITVQGSISRTEASARLSAIETSSSGSISSPHSEPLRRLTRSRRNLARYVSSSLPSLRTSKLSWRLNSKTMEKESRSMTIGRISWGTVSSRRTESSGTTAGR